MNTRHLNLDAKIERKFVEIITRKCKEQGLLKGEFAELVWPDTSKAVSRARWTSIRHKATHTGKPQSVTIRDAFRMARIVNENLFTLLGAAVLEVEDEERKEKKGR